MTVIGRPLVSFGREICGDLDAALRREWLVTNGRGGYASGIVAGRQHRCGEQAAAVIDERELEVVLRQVLEICLGSLTRQILSVELPNGAGAPWPAYERPTAPQHAVDAAGAASR